MTAVDIDPENSGVKDYCCRLTAEGNLRIARGEQFRAGSGGISCVERQAPDWHLIKILRLRMPGVQFGLSNVG